MYSLTPHLLSYNSNDVWFPPRLTFLCLFVQAFVYPAMIFSKSNINLLLAGGYSEEWNIEGHWTLTSVSEVQIKTK